MPYIVEDGTNVAGANGYATLAYIREYAADRGVTLSDDDTALTVQAIKAMDYLAQYSMRYKGVRVYGYGQATDFPRDGMYFYGQLWAKDQIPPAIMNAQAQLCIEQANGVDIMPTTGGTVTDRDRFLIEDTTGPLTQKWSEGVSTVGTTVPILRSVENLLAGLFNTSAARSYRV